MFLNFFIDKVEKDFFYISLSLMLTFALGFSIFFDVLYANHPFLYTLLVVLLSFVLKRVFNYLIGFVIRAKIFMNFLRKLNKLNCKYRYVGYNAVTREHTFKKDKNNDDYLIPSRINVLDSGKVSFYPTFKIKEKDVTQDIMLFMEANDLEWTNLSKDDKHFLIINFDS